MEGFLEFIISNDLESFEIISLTARTDFKTLATQINSLSPKFAVIEDSSKLEDLKKERIKGKKDNI